MHEPILDEWLERLTRPSPATRAKAQIKDLRATSRKTMRQLAKHPHDHRTADILSAQKVREREILARGKKPLPGPPVNFWTNDPGLKLGWAIFVAVLVLMLYQFIGWWTLVVFPVGWLVSLSFFWTITVPSLIAFVLLLVLAATGTFG